jgi:ribosomal protein S3AE
LVVNNILYTFVKTIKEMENGTSIRIELGIDARKIIQRVQIGNELIEQQIAKGIELAIKDITEDENFINYVREASKKELTNVVSKAVMSWDIQQKVSKMINEKVSLKIEEYANKVAEKLTEKLD